MPGESSLLPQYYEDDFQVVVFNNAAAAPHDPTILLYADRDMIIDEIVVGVHAVGGTSSTISFEAVTDISTNNPTAVPMATVNIDTSIITAGDTLVLTTDGITRTTAAGVVTTSSTGTTAINGITAGVQSNLIRKGSWLIADLNSIGAGRVAIQVRFRSRLK